MFQKIVTVILLLVISFNSLADNNCQERVIFFKDLIFFAESYNYEIRTRNIDEKINPATVEEFTIIIYDDYHLTPFHINIRNGKGCGVVVMNSSGNKNSEIVYGGFNDLVSLAKINSGFDKVFFR